LMDHVRHISFRADRHAGLLSYDPGLERAVLNPSSSWVEDDFEYFGRLLDLQLLYQNASPTAAERRRVARGFADAVQGHFDVYLQLMAGVKWERDGSGEWERSCRVTASFARRPLSGHDARRCGRRAW